MDVLTPRGQEAVARERDAAAIFEAEMLRRGRSVRYVPTRKDRPATVDAVIVENDEVVAVVETKCRSDFDLATFRGEYGSRWLVTFDKIERCRIVAAGLSVPLLGFLYVVRDGVLLWVQIADARGEFVVPFDVRVTPTTATCNGGEARRANAFIGMGAAFEARGGG